MVEEKFGVFSKKLGKTLVISVPPEVSKEKMENIFNEIGLHTTEWSQWSEWSNWADWAQWSEWGKGPDDSLVDVRNIIDSLIDPVTKAEKIDPEIVDSLKSLQKVLDKKGYKASPGQMTENVQNYSNRRAGQSSLKRERKK